MRILISFLPATDAVRALQSKILSHLFLSQSFQLPVVSEIVLYCFHINNRRLSR